MGFVGRDDKRAGGYSLIYAILCFFTFQGFTTSGGSEEELVEIFL